MQSENLKFLTISPNRLARGTRTVLFELNRQARVYAPMGGKVQDLLAQVGNTLEAKDLIAVIA